MVAVLVLSVPDRFAKLGKLVLNAVIAYMSAYVTSRVLLKQLGF